MTALVLVVREFPENASEKDWMFIIVTANARTTKIILDFHLVQHFLLPRALELILLLESHIGSEILLFSTDKSSKLHPTHANEQ